MNAVHAYLEGKSYSHIIWDWNGTLLNDFQLCHDILCEELQEAGLPKLLPESHRELFRFPVQDFYQSIGFNFKEISFEALAKKYMDRYRTRVLQCKLFEEAEHFLEKTWKEGVSHAILSAAPQKDLRAQVEYFGIHSYFTHVFGLVDDFAASKVERGKDLIRTWKIDPSEALLIGDTDHDLEVGNALGVDVLLIADGHQSFEKLCRVHGDVLRSRKLS
jgi:phosphoglycolate phosphatase